MRTIFYLVMATFVLCLHISCEKTDHDHQHADEKHAHHQEKEHGHGEDTDDHHETQSNVGPGFAVVEADPHTGFKLSEKAIRTIGVKTIPVSSEGKTVIQHAAIIHDRNETGIYRLRDEWFHFVPIQEDKASDHVGELLITTPELKAGDRVVISGAPLLRITELDLFTEDVGGHHH